MEKILVSQPDPKMPDSTIDGSLPAQRCENCRYWGKANNLTACRRKPGVPALMNNPGGYQTCITLFPPALANEWCGEWASLTYPNGDIRPLS